MHGQPTRIVGVYAANTLYGYTEFFLNQVVDILENIPNKIK